MIIDNQFITTHEPLVRLIVFQYHYPHLTDDLLQEGRMALLYAAKRFNPNRGITFPSYASWWIHRFVQSAIRQYGHVVSYPLNTPLDEINCSSSIDGVVSNDDEDPIMLSDVLNDPEETPEVQTARTHREQQFDALAKALHSLSSRAEYVIRHFYGIRTPKCSIEQIANDLQISCNATYLILERAKKKIAKIIH